MRFFRAFGVPSPFIRRPARFLVPLAAFLLAAASTASAIQLYVFVPVGGGYMQVEVEPEDLVQAVKLKIQDGSTSAYFAVSKQVLLFGDEVLEDDRTLASYHIVDESELELRLPELQAEMARLLGQAGNAAAQLGRANRLVADFRRFDRRSTAALRALNKARTPGGVRRAKARLFSQIRKLDSSIVRLSKSVRQMSGLFGSVTALSRELGAEGDELAELAEVFAELRSSNAEMTKLRRLLRQLRNTVNRYKIPKAKAKARAKAGR